MTARPELIHNQCALCTATDNSLRSITLSFAWDLESVSKSVCHKCWRNTVCSIVSDRINIKINIKKYSMTISVELDWIKGEVSTKDRCCRIIHLCHRVYWQLLK